MFCMMFGFLAVANIPCCSHIFEVIDIWLGHMPSTVHVLLHHKFMYPCKILTPRVDISAHIAKPDESYDIYSSEFTIGSEYIFRTWNLRIFVGASINNRSTITCSPLCLSVCIYRVSKHGKHQHRMVMMGHPIPRYFLGGTRIFSILLGTWTIDHLPTHAKLDGFAAS